MRKYEHYPEYHDFFEYCGTNEIKRVRIKGGRIVRRDWLVFETIDEAVNYFRRVCGAFDAYASATNQRIQTSLYTKRYLKTSLVLTTAVFVVTAL